MIQENRFPEYTVGPISIASSPDEGCSNPNRTKREFDTTSDLITGPGTENQSPVSDLLCSTKTSGRMRPTNELSIKSNAFTPVLKSLELPLVDTKFHKFAYRIDTLPLFSIATDR